MLWNRSNSRNRIETQEITFRQWSVLIERKAFRRNMTISLKPGEPIRIRAGRSTPLHLIEKLLKEKESWIDKHMQEFERLAEKFPDKKLAPSETFPFLGEMLILRFVPTLISQVFFSRQQNYLQLHMPQELWNRLTEEEMQKFFPKLLKFYQREAEKTIQQRIDIWSERMQLFPKALRFRNQKTRWGSCTSKGSIQINWRLIGAPLEVIDYILIHELAHLKHMNHSEAFWNLVEQYCPSYKQSENWLKENHGLLDFLMRETTSN